MFNWLKKAYFRIPHYGQLVARKGAVTRGWYKEETETETYFSVMLKGNQRGMFNSGRFYIVLTESGLNEAIARGSKNLKYTNTVLPVGEYTGIVSVEPDNTSHKLPIKQFECVFLHTFRYIHGGKIKDHVIVLSERQFRRAISRAKSHPELVRKHKITDGLVTRLYNIFCKEK